MYLKKHIYSQPFRIIQSEDEFTFLFMAVLKMQTPPKGDIFQAFPTKKKMS